MKKNYLLKTLFVLIMVVNSVFLFGQDVYTFTTCGSTGRYGPTQAQVNTAYSGTNLDGSVTINTQGIQEWTVPQSGTYQISASGAKGGNYSTSYYGGDGANVIGEFDLTAGNVIQIAVGQMGVATTSASAGGGGGSFVYNLTSTTLLAVGAGGGGASYKYDGMDGSSSNSGDVAGTASDLGGGGGGSFSYNGVSSGQGFGGYAFLNGATGGCGWYYESCNEIQGGFGGGGGGSWDNGNDGAGGAGGYSGGDGGAGGATDGSGSGGGSYNSGTNQVNTSGANSGDGQVIITLLCDPLSVDVDPGTDVCPGTMVTLTATSSNGGTITWDNGITNGVAFEANGTVTYTATSDYPDDCIATVIITAVDDTDPEITCPGDIAIDNDEGLCEAVVDYTVPIGTDNCPDPVTELTAGFESGASFPVGLTVVTYTVTDASSNTASCSFNVTVNDTEDPAINCPENISVDNDAGECGAVVTYDAPVANDNCEVSSLVMTEGLASGSLFPIGITTVWYKATDPAGNADSCSFTVTVTDSELPEITCPGDIAMDNDAGQCSAVVTYTAPVGTDNCSGAVTTQINGLGSGATFPIGVTTETYVVTDGAGLTDTCSFTVTVTDSELPEITCPGDITVDNDAGQCNAVVTYTAPVGTDNCTGTTTEMTEGFESGSAFPIGETTVSYKVTDAYGNADSCSFLVTVNDSEKPVITCLEDTTICAYSEVDLSPVIEDNCEVDTLYTLSGATTGTGEGAVLVDDFEVGITEVEYIAIDGSGNSDTCTFIVTVKSAYETTLTEEICEGESYTLPDGSIVDEPGTYISIFEMANECDSTIIVELTVNPVYSSTVNASICYGETYTLPDGSSANEEGTYSSTFESVNGCDSIIIVELTVTTVNVGVTVSDATLTADAAGAEYQWLDCNDSNAPISGATDQSYTATESGNYAVEITQEGCQDVSDCYTVSLNALSETEITEDILVYPNPVIDILSIDLGKVYESLHISILSLQGQVVFEFNETNKELLNYNLSDLRPGTYFLRIVSEDTGVSGIIQFNKK